MGYRIEAIASENVTPAPAIKRHVIAGLAASLALFAIYASLLIIAQGVPHALEQTIRLWYWLLALGVGFGVQVGLFSFIKHSLRERRKSLTAGVAASGGVSASSMAACCAHHLSDVLPLLGLSGLAAFLVDYQLFFIIVGVMANAVGVTIMLETVQRHSLSPLLARWRGDMGRLKKGTTIAAILITLVAFLVTTL